MANQKINWLSWGKEVFDKALYEKKPVLLDIHGVWCHWCHVMDETTYSNASVIELVSEYFVPIKVDTDRRPDINERYNAGGWPSTVALTPSGSVIDNATYLAPDEMLSFLKSALNSFHVLGEQLDMQAQHKKNSEGSWEGHLAAPDDFVQAVLLEAKNSFDAYFGGFGREPKFPMPPVLSFLEVYYLYTKDKAAKIILEKTLSSMHEKGLFDKQENGFYRYTTTADWSIPHYEKMLEDNARLLVVYMNASKLFESRAFFGVSKKIIEYMSSSLFDECQNYFFASQDADEEYYKLPLHERKKLKKPLVDKTLFTDLNCLAVESFLSASVFFNDDSLEKMAIDCLEKVYEKCTRNGLVLHFVSGNEKEPGFLQDHAFLIHASLKAFSYSQDKKFLQKAIDVYSIAKENFFDEKEKCFFDSEKKPHDIGLLQSKKKTPSLNSVMAENLFLLNEVSPSKEFEETASTANEASVRGAFHAGIFAAVSAETALKTTKGFLCVKVPLHTASKDFLRKVLYNDFNNMIVFASSEAIENTAVVCSKNKCFAPVKEITGLDFYEKLK